jgi:hypothetical protein
MYRVLLVAGARSLMPVVEAPGAVLLVIIVGAIVATLLGLLIVVRRLILSLRLAIAMSVKDGAVGAPEAHIQATAASHLEVMPLGKERQRHLLVRSAKVVIECMIAGSKDTIGHIHPLQVLQGVVEHILVSLGCLQEGKKALELLLGKSRGAQRAAAGTLVGAGGGVVLRVNAGTERLDAVAARAVEVTVNRKGHLGRLGSNTGLGGSLGRLPCLLSKDPSFSIFL